MLENDQNENIRGYCCFLVIANCVGCSAVVMTKQYRCRYNAWASLLLWCIRYSSAWLSKIPFSILHYWTIGFYEIHLYLKFLLLETEHRWAVLLCINFYIHALKEEKLIILLLCFLYYPYSGVGWFVCFSWPNTITNAVKYLTLVSQQYSQRALYFRL